MLSEYTGESDFPIILKPMNSIGWTKADMKLYSDSKKVIEEKGELIKKYGEMQVQEFIPGNNRNLYEVHTYNSSNGPLIAGIQRNTHGIETNPYVYMGVVFETAPKWDLVKKALRLTENLKYNRPLDINLKRSDRDGKFYFMEVNLRTSANLMLDTDAGLNLPAIVYKDLIRENFSHLSNEPLQVGRQWIHEERIDKYNEKHNPRVLREIYSKNSTTRVFYSPEDPKPYDQHKGLNKSLLES